MEIVPVGDVEEIPHVLKPLQSSTGKCGVPQEISINSICLCGATHV